MAFRNQQLADGLRRHAMRLESGSAYRYALLIAAKNIEARPSPLETDRQAIEVKGVGQKIVHELCDLGLQRSRCIEGRHFIDGANAARPGKLRRSAVCRGDFLHGPSGTNPNIASELCRVASAKDGGFRIALLAAARNIKRWPECAARVKTLMEIPGVNAAIAKIVVCDILHKELTAADEAFLNGSTVKRCQPWCRSDAGGGHAAANAGLLV